MADNTPTPNPVPTFDKTKALEHLTKVRKHYESFSGKPTYNPHFRLNDVIKPLESRVKSGETTPALMSEVLALKEDCRPIEQLVDNATDAKLQETMKPKVAGLSSGSQQR